MADSAKPGVLYGIYDHGGQDDGDGAPTPGGSGPERDRCAHRIAHDPLEGASAADAGRHPRSPPRDPLGLLLVPSPRGLDHRQVDLLDVCLRSDPARPRRSDHPARHPLAEPLRYRRRTPTRGGRRQPAPSLDVALVLPADRLLRRAGHDCVPLAALAGARRRRHHLDRNLDLVRSPCARTLQGWEPRAPHPGLLPLHLQLPDLHGAVADDGHLSDPRLSSPATPSGASSSTTSAARPRRRKRSAESSRSGSPARSSRRRAASASAGCSSTAHPAPARR